MALPQSSLPGKVIIIGAGIAGASVAHAFARRGIAVNVLERAQPACGGSGNPVAVVRAEPGGAHHPIAALSAAGVLWLINWIAQHGQSVPHDFCGVLRLTRDARRHNKLAELARTASADWLRELSQEAASALCGQPVADAAFLLPQAGWVQPVALVNALLAHPLITLQTDAAVDSLLQDDMQRWQLTLADGSKLETALLVLASAFAAPLLPLAYGIASARGQLSCLPERAGKSLHMIVCRDGYITPAINGIHTIGATIQTNDDYAHARLADDAENFERLQSVLPDFVTDAAQLQSGRVSWRGVTQDRLPLVGKMAEGLYASLAHGARGITCAPLCGEWLAASMLGEDSPLSAEWQRLLDPLRFIKPD